VTVAPITAFVVGSVVITLPEAAKKEAKVAIRWRLSAADKLITCPKTKNGFKECCYS